MFCYFCGKDIINSSYDQTVGAKELTSCPYCGHPLTAQFNNDYAYISNETDKRKSLCQYCNTFFNSLAPILIIVPLYFWIFYYIEHNFSDFTSLAINVILTGMTILMCSISILGFAYINKKKQYPSILEKFNMTASFITGISCFIVNYFGIFTPLGDAYTDIEIITTYRLLLIISIFSFSIGVIIIITQLLRKKISYHMLSNAIAVTALFEFSFYYSAFNYSVNGSDVISFILYSLPLLGGGAMTVYFYLRKRVKL